MKNSDKRDNIMQAALELMAVQGFHGAPMADIAQKAGVGAGTIYLYFKSRDDLIIDLYRYLEEMLKATILEDFPEAMPVKERFLTTIKGVLKYLIAHPLHFRFMEQYANSPYGISLQKENYPDNSGNPNILMSIIEDGSSQKILKDVSKAVLFSLATGPLMFLIRNHILGFINLDDTLIDKVAEACWDGIKR